MIMIMQEGMCQQIVNSRQGLGEENNHWIKEDMLQWIVSSGKMQRKDERKLRVEIVEPQISKGIVIIDPKGTCIIGSWTLDEMLQEKVEFENRNSRSMKGEINLVHWFGRPHVT
jgi:hypothetical protein